MRREPINLVPATLLVVVLVAASALASIEREPVKVTHRNSGPRYDIDDVERTRLGSENPESNQVPTGLSRPQELDNGQGQQDAPMVSIRRIFLVPMMPQSGDNDDQSSSQPDGRFGGMFGGPQRPSFWPFALHPTRHLFGADDASRPPSADQDDREKQMASASGEREEPMSNERPDRPMPLLDPIEMLMNAMRQALNPDNMMLRPQIEDLNKEASGENKPTDETALKRPMEPKSFNETKEDIVEIEGKKYLRKTIVNRRIGEGIMFMTKRLIFSPLNDTDSDTPSTTTLTSLPANKEATTIVPPTEKPVVTEKTSETDSSSTASSEPKESVTTEAVPTEPPSTLINIQIIDPTTTSTEAPKPEETTKAESIGERVSEAVDKVERLMEKMIERKEESTTVKPSESS